LYDGTSLLSKSQKLNCEVFPLFQVEKMHINQQDQDVQFSVSLMHDSTSCSNVRLLFREKEPGITFFDVKIGLNLTPRITWPSLCASISDYHDLKDLRFE
jgi:hypothetical protein